MSRTERSSSWREGKRKRTEWTRSDSMNSLSLDTSKNEIHLSVMRQIKPSVCITRRCTCDSLAWALVLTDSLDNRYTWNTLQRSRENKITLKRVGRREVASGGEIAVGLAVTNELNCERMNYSRDRGEAIESCDHRQLVAWVVSKAEDLQLNSWFSLMKRSMCQDYWEWDASQFNVGEHLFIPLESPVISSMSTRVVHWKHLWLIFQLILASSPINLPETIISQLLD